MAEIGKTGESIYLALIADVVGSRGVGDRQGIQDALLETLDGFAGHEQDYGLVTRPVLTAGDEIQALFTQPTRVVDVMRQLSDAIQPVRFCFGLGLGPLSTKLAMPPGAKILPPEMLPRLDGPCFHHAREALLAAQDLDSWGAARGFAGFDQPLDANIEMLGTLRHGWTERQGAFTAMVRGRTQKEVAAAADVSPSVVSESLKAAHFETVKRGETGLADLLRLAVGAEHEGSPPC